MRSWCLNNRFKSPGANFLKPLEIPCKLSVSILNKICIFGQSSFVFYFQYAKCRSENGAVVLLSRLIAT